MIITNNFLKFIIHRQATIREALTKIKTEKMRIIFAVDEDNRVEGLLTMGDILRWVVSQELVNLNVAVGEIVNKNFHYVQAGTDHNELLRLFEKKKIHTVPIVDKQMKLIAVACSESRKISIGSFVIDENSPSYVIAEIGNNHNGSIELAHKLVDEAVMAGADCVKFQMRDVASLYSNRGDSNDPSADLGTQYTLDLLEKNQLSTKDMLLIFDYCRKKGVEPLCTPWDEVSVRVLEDYGMHAYKVASADLTNHDLLRTIAATHKPMICSTGMSTEQEIIDAVQVLKSEGAQFILLHCNATYPAPFKDINLRYLKKLHKLGECPVGYSGHERGFYVPLAAVSLGAKVIEKHFTLDRNMEGNDHKVSLLPAEFADMVRAIRIVEEAMGDPFVSRTVSQGEMINRETLAKSLVATRDIIKGSVITEDMIEVRSPGKGLPPYRKADLVGTVARRDICSNDFFYPSDLKLSCAEAKDYNFPQPWGVPVRFHDWEKIAACSNMDLLEFHLSYKDLELCVDDYFKDDCDFDFVVHSPELFAGDHILDLCSPDEEYRRLSIREFKKVADITLEMKKYFPKNIRPRIVTNIGGFSDHRFLGPKRREALIANFKRSLEELRSEEYEILPQTMPPFPWHFGGQRYHNIMVDALEIKELCETENLMICLDVSHSQLACNYFKWSMEEFVSEVAPYTSHVHLADADGFDGEGLQIGEGSMDFFQLSRLLSQYAPKASFIPEIWQGHKNEGEGFWVALERLEHFFFNNQQKEKDYINGKSGNYSCKRWFKAVAGQEY